MRARATVLRMLRRKASGLFTKLAHAAKRIADSPGEAKKVETAIRNVRTDITLG